MTSTPTAPAVDQGAAGIADDVTTTPPPTPPPSRTVTVDAAEFRRALDRVRPAVMTPRGSPAVWLGAVLLTVDDDGATVTATDLDLTITVTLDDVVTLCPNETAFRAVIPHRDAKAFLVKRTGPLTVTLDAGEIRFENAGGAATLLALDVNEWPAAAIDRDPVDVDGFPLPLDVIGETLPAVATDETRPILNGLLIDGPGRTVVGCDSYRLHVVDGIDVGPDVVLIPRGAMLAAVKLAGKKNPAPLEMRYARRIVTGGADRGQLSPRDVEMSGPGFVVRTRLIEGEYPNWRGLIPSDPPRRIVFGEPVAAVLAPMTKYDQAPARITATGTDVLDGRGVMLECRAVDRGTIVAAVRGEYPDGLDVVGFNPAYLIDAVTGLETGPVTFRGTDCLKPWAIDETRADGSRRIRLLMPVRIA